MPPAAARVQVTHNQFNMTLLKVSRTHYLIRVYIKGMLCAFYVEAKNNADAFSIGNDEVARIQKLEGKAFSDYLVPGASRQRKRLDYLPERSEV